jgi:hypothetical protein
MLDTLFTDLKKLIDNNWKVLLLLVLVFYVVYSYPDIKQGMQDGWLGR